MTTTGTPLPGTVRGLAPRLAALRGAGLRGLTGFGALHVANTALNMGFTLAQLLVLARILPLGHYAEIVFLTAIGFYFQPINQAIGRANFLVLRGGAVTANGPEAQAAGPDLRVLLGGQACVLVLAALAIPCALAPPGSGRWAGDALFLFLCLSINFWAFDLQSTAWSIDRGLAFVRISLLQRTVHVGALALAWWTGSFPAFVGLAAFTSVVGMAVVLRLFARAGLFASAGAPDWRRYGGVLRTSILSTLVDFAVLNAPYALIAGRFGIGPTLIAFDCTMKMARITMAGARTLAEIALPRHSRLVAQARRAEARRLYTGVCLLSAAAAAVPALVVLTDGPRVFSLLLGSSDVVPAAAALPAALIVLTAGLYQPVMFFLSYGGRQDLIQALTILGFAILLAFAAALYALPPGIPETLTAFSLGFLVLLAVAGFLGHRLFAAPPPKGADAPVPRVLPEAVRP